MLVIDNFIKDKDHLKILKNENTWDGFPKFNWWDGWWVCKPRNIMEKVIEGGSGRLNPPSSFLNQAKELSI